MDEQPTRATWVWTLAISALVSAASLWGLLSDGAYGEASTNWATQARGRDIGNLLAVATVLASGYRYQTGSHRAGLMWLGTLFYLAYAYVVYAMAVHFNQLFLVYVAVLGLISYAVMFSVGRLRAADEPFPCPARRKFAGHTSITIGVLFGGLWLSELIPATLSGDAPQSVRDAGLWVNPIHVIDLAVLLPAMIIAGVLTLRRHTAGEFFVGPLLVFSVLMGTSIVAAMILMTADGSKDTVVPLVVSVIVLASLVAAWRYLRPYGDARRRSVSTSRSTPKPGDRQAPTESPTTGWVTKPGDVHVVARHPLQLNGTRR